MDLFLEVIGWIGSIAVLLAYGLNSYQKIGSDSILFYGLNLAGGLLLVIYTIYKEAYPNTFINVCWVLVALIALGKVLMKTPDKKEP